MAQAKNRWLSFIFGLFIVIGGSVLAQASLLSEGAGDVCTQINEKELPYIGQFEATYEDLFDNLQLRAKTACFKSDQACENWRYDIQSENIYYNIYRNSCSKR